MLQMTEEEAQKNSVLMLAVKAGEIMLKSGAEVYRTEDTMERICRSCGFPFAECLITTTGIFASLGDKTLGTDVQTVIKRIRRLSTDLEKVSLVNAYVRAFVAQSSHSEADIQAGLLELDRIDSTKGFFLPIRLLAMVLIALFYTMMNGGSLVDGLFTTGIAVVAYLFSRGVERLRINRFIVVFASCFLVAALALLVYNLGLCSSLSAMIIGSIIVFLPGVAITNAARDLLSGDMLAGVSRATESILVSIAIAGGVGIFLRFGPAAIHPDIHMEFALPLAFLFAFIGTMGIAVMLNIPRRHLLFVGIIAACGWVVYQVVIGTGNSRILGCFLGTCTIALLAEVATRLAKDAATLFIVPAIFPLVPGKVMYAAMLEMINGNPDAAIITGSEAVLMAGGIAVALLVMISLTRITSSLYRRARKLESA